VGLVTQDVILYTPRPDCSANERWWEVEWDQKLVVLYSRGKPSWLAGDSSTAMMGEIRQRWCRIECADSRRTSIGSSVGVCGELGWVGGTAVDVAMCLCL
jgi:hypothetical protein